MRLDYETANFFDGNIGKQEWKSSFDNVKRSFTYTYDGGSRIKTGIYASDNVVENYSLNNVNYDFNGNITNLSRNGWKSDNTFGLVDNLNYTYQANSNKIQSVTDASYWLDGSLKRDKNKKISLTYNYLKLPEIITFDNGRTITTEYDAEGTKLKKIVSDGETTDYEEDEIYVNDVLYQTSHDEGRIVNGVYEYNITDHNNDLRVAFKDSLGFAVPIQSIFYDPWGLSMKGMQITRNPLSFLPWLVEALPPMARCPHLTPCESNISSKLVPDYQIVIN